MKRIFACALLCILPLFLSSCATFTKAKNYDLMRDKLYSMKAELEREKEIKREAIAQLTREKENLIQAKNDEISRLLQEKKELEDAREIYLTKQAELRTLLETKDKEIAGLKNELAVLQKRANAMNTKLLSLEAEKEKTVEAVKEKETQISKLEQARQDLEESLKTELAEYKAKLKMTERGLVITFLAEIFFDSGKNVIREEAKGTLAKVAAVLNRKVPDSYVAVEGYTDNDPIRHSHWESNWELSTARALAVLHYFVDTAGVNPARLAAIGYGEYRPVASNETEAGQQQNRRVEIVILPEKLKKVKEETDVPAVQGTPSERP